MKIKQTCPKCKAVYDSGKLEFCICGGKLSTPYEGLFGDMFNSDSTKGVDGMFNDLFNKKKK